MLCKFTIALLLTAFAAMSLQSTNPVQAKGPKDDKMPPGIEKQDKKPAHFDGESVVTCDHPIDRESRTVIRTRTAANGKKVMVPTVEEVESMIVCPNTSHRAELTMMTAAASYNNYRCYTSQQSTSLGLLEYRMAISQYFSTTAYSNIVWPPPPVEALNIKADHGWKAEGAWIPWGPNRLTFFSPGIVKSGKSAVTQRFNFNLFWYNAETRDARIEVEFSHGRCRYNWSGF